VVVVVVVVVVVAKGVHMQRSPLPLLRGAEQSSAERSSAE